MRYEGAYSMLTYTSDDGQSSEQVWNGRDGVIPGYITLLNGKTASHTGPDTFEGPGWTPPPGTRTFQDTPPPDTDPQGVTLGWPGQPYLHAAGE